MTQINAESESWRLYNWLGLMNMNDELPIKSIFKAYDIRGIVGSELTNPIVKKIGQAIGTTALSQKQKPFV